MVSVNNVLRQTIKLRSYDFASHGVEVVEDFDEALAPALGDAQQLQQVFLNILNNAYDAVTWCTLAIVQHANIAAAQHRRPCKFY